MAEIKDIEGIPHKQCTKCKTFVQLSAYHATKRNADGSVKYYHSWCRTCLKANYDENNKDKAKKIPVITDTCKECLECRVLLPFSEFSPQPRGRLGLSAYCRKCVLIRRKRNPNHLQITRDITARYREKHRERWRAMHRITQFNRRSKIKATEDGTVTDIFLDFIYRLVHCYWCKKETVPEERTLEHVVELSQGGAHSASNIRMACLSCNSARKGKKK